MAIGPNKASGARSGFRRVLEPMAQRDFRWFWASSSTQALSQGMQFLVLAWLVLEVTGSSTKLGLVFFLYGIPNVVILTVSGVLADRVDRRNIMIATQAAVGLLITALGLLTATGQINVWHIYVAGAILGVVQGLNMPARTAIISDLVEERSLLDAVALVNASVHVGRILGPFMIGYIIDYWGLSLALFLNSACYAISIVCLYRVDRAGDQARAGQGRARSANVFANFTEGLRYIRSSPVVLSVMVTTCAFGGFGMSHNQVIPAFAKDVFGNTAGGVGLLLMASGIGAFIGSIILPMLNRDHLYRWLLVAMVLFIATLTLFAWSTWFWVAWALFVLVGIFGLGMVWSLATTISQTSSPREVRGRVMGVLQFTPGFHYLGALPLAILADSFGWGVAISISTGLFLFVVVWFGILRRAGRNLIRGIDSAVDPQLQANPREG